MPDARVVEALDVDSRSRPAVVTSTRRAGDRGGKLLLAPTHVAVDALGDRAGALEEFDAVPARVINYVRAKTGQKRMEDVLEAALKLSRGFRREEYRQAIWMT